MARLGPLPEPIHLDDSTWGGANTSEWFDWPLETIQLDGSTWLPNPIHLNGSTWLPKPIRLNSSTWLMELQYRSTFQSSNLIGQIRVNLGC